MPVDFDQRILELIDRMDKKIDDLCNRTTILEQSLQNHFNEITKRQETKHRRFYYIIGVFGGIITLYETMKELMN